MPVPVPIPVHEDSTLQSSNCGSQPYKPPTADTVSYRGVTLSSQLEAIVLVILSMDPMYLSLNAEKVYQEGKSIHTRWVNHEKNKLVRSLCGRNAQISPTSSTPMVLLQSIKLSDEASRDCINLSERVLNNQRAPSALLSQYEKMEGVYFHLLTFFWNSPTDLAATILEAIENTIASAGILGVPNCPIKTLELVSWIAGGEGSWFAILHNRVFNNPNVAERLRRFQEKTITPHLAQTASTLGLSELLSWQFVDGNSIVSSTPPLHKPGLDTSLPDLGEQMYGIGGEIDRADKAIEAEAKREEVSLTDLVKNIKNLTTTTGGQVLREIPSNLTLFIYHS
ncbi:hypothetical protein RhiJN_01449 [Ceratobasidium sp. AG-Ba]|nr:hypothetical protein RhiJN_01449 [Ceratobasidium sp. AG-Ba]